MFVPAHFRSAERTRHLEVMRSFPLAVLVTGVGAVPDASHVPTIVWSDAGGPPDGAANGPAAGLVLRGHMNRANPQWKSLPAAGQALLVFCGPQGYVSPIWYGFTPAAPTWNFVVVHARGRVRQLSGAEETMDVIRSTVAEYEALAGTGWNMSMSIRYFHRIVGGVGAFEVLVDDIQGMFKLSQDQAPDTRQQVARRFSVSEVGLHRELAQAMLTIAPPESGEKCVR